MIKRIESNLIGSNVFAVFGKAGCVLIDAGADVESVQKIVGNNKVLAVLLTHGHYDHCFYALSYAEKFGCKIYASQHAKEYLENPDYNYSEGKFAVRDFSDFVFLSGDGKLCFGDLEFEYFSLGGHSKSDICYALKDDIFVGDLLIGRDMGRIDLFGGDKAEMKKSLEFLAGKNYRIMHSGHGEDNAKEVQDKVIKIWTKFLSR